MKRVAPTHVKAREAQRNRAKQALKDSQSRLSGIIESAMDAIITVDSRQRILVFNHGAEQMFRCPAREALGQPLDRFIPEHFRKSHNQHIEAFGKTAVTTRTMGGARAVSGLRADGEEFPVEASISQIEVMGQKLFTVIMRDITKRKRDEERIREQAALLDQARDAIIVRDLENCVVYWNKGAEALFGWTAAEFVGKNARDLLYQNDLTQFDRAMQTLINTGEWSGELLIVGKNESPITVDSRWTLVRDHNNEPKSVLVIDTDISEKKKMEEQFLRAQRMESIGTLAGGIAHDLNNVLSPIMMALQVLKMKYVDEESRAWLKMLETSAERGAAMVKQVLSFARGSGGKHVEFQTKHLLSELVKIIKETFPKSIEIQFHLPSDLWVVTGDPTQLHQVFMNLCVNSRDALPQGGSIRLKAQNTIIDETFRQVNLDVQPGEYVRVTVADNGTGMDREVANRIFEPFFTTKGVGQGTGLGLSTTLSIVKSHGGFIRVYSEVGQGTETAVYVPASKSTQIEPVQESHTLPVGHKELVLVVDDENSIRQITKSTLETFGYRVMLASDGTEAVAIYAANREEIKVIITDMMMPFMDGIATIRAIRRLKSNARIISTSGLGDQVKIAEASRAGVDKFLPKPYTAEQLLKALAEVLA